MSKTANTQKLLQQFQSSLESEGKSFKTIESYLGDAKSFLNYLQQKDVQFTGEIKRFYITSYKQYLIEHNYKTNTINKKINSLQSFNHFLISQQLTTEMAVNFGKDMIKIAGGSEQEVEIFTDEELERILFYIHDANKVSCRNRAIVYILLYTGVRVSELVNIRLQDTDFLTMQLTIVGKGGKQREIPLRPEVIQAVQEYIELERNHSQYANSRYLFLTQRAGKMDRDCVNKVLNQMARELSLTIKPHKFRHTFCTRLLKKGIDIATVAKLAGHAGIQTTARFYINTSREDKQAAVSVL